MCKCSHTSSDHEKLWTLLEDEKNAREQLLKNINHALRSSDQTCLGACQETLIAFKDYLLGMQILTDGMRLQFIPQSIIHDTIPHHMSFENPKAPETLRCITPEKKS